jgi:hypothetical protein
MLDTKMNNLKQIEWIKPRAFLVDDPHPVKLIVELSNKHYAFLLPSSYEIERIIPKYIYEAAVSKYGYQLVLGEHTLHNKEDLITFLKWFKSRPL